MEKVYLTPEQQLQYDPEGKIRKMLNRFSGDYSYSPLPDYIQGDPREIIDKYILQVRKNTTSRHNPYFAYWDEMISKCGRQGGNIPLYRVEELYQPFYDNAKLNPKLDVVLIGRDYLIRRIRDIRTMFDINCVPEPAPVTGTYAGIPTGLHKGEFDAETVGMHPGFRHLLPCVPGVRRMRNKDRVINQDANPNVRYIERVTGRARSFLRNYFPEYFGAWLNPSCVIQPTLTRALARRWTNIEIDFHHMDESFNREIALNIYYPVMQAIYGEDLLFLGHYLTEVFEMPVYLGTYLLTGEHNWFSGIACTQDAETIYSVCLLLGSVLAAGYDPQVVSMQAIGDDSILLLPQKFRIEDIWSILVNETDANCMFLSKDKCRIDTGDYRFCRRVYYDSAPRDAIGNVIGAYPTILALNSIIQPENLITDLSTLFVATCQRLDNALGSPDCVLFWQFVSKVIKIRKWGTIDATSGIELYTKRDWWYRVYGESFSFDSSPYYKWLNHDK